MNLANWVTNECNTTKTSRRTVLECLAGESGVAFCTLESTMRGARMGNYLKARAVSEATDWKVSVLDLCDPDPDAMRAILRASK